MISVEETLLGGERIPLVWQVTRGQDARIEEVVGWLREVKPRLSAARDRHGGVLMRGFEAIDSASSFAAVLDVIADELMDYVGGTSPRKVVSGRVFTATELPGTHSIALHQEMAYQQSRPDALALFCEVPPEEGGETTIADARVVTERIDPEVRARFEAKGVGVMRVMPSPARGEDSYPRPWSFVLGTKDRDEAERIAQDKGWKIEWKPDGSAHVWQTLLPAFKAHPRTGERVWANQVHYHMPECQLRWAIRDQRHADAEAIGKRLAEAPDTFDQCFHSDGTRVSGADAEHVWDVLERSEIPLRWQRGDVLLVDNVLSMHGRRAFRSRRRLLVGLIRDAAA